MARPSARRPLPALAFLLGLSLLTALVWWRVIHRADADSHQAASCPSSSATALPPVTTVPLPSSVTVNVLNSTTRTGLAHATSVTLHKDGFQIGIVDNDSSVPAPIPGVGQIRYGTAGRAAATLMSFYLPGATLVQTERTDAQVEVSLGLQYKAVATAAQVKAAMAAKHVTQSAPRTGNQVKTPTPRATTPTPTKSSTPTC